jgi:hypothetical protein
MNKILILAMMTLATSLFAESTAFRDIKFGTKISWLGANKDNPIDNKFKEYGFKYVESDLKGDLYNRKWKNHSNGISVAFYSHLKLGVYRSIIFIPNKIFDAKNVINKIETNNNVKLTKDTPLSYTFKLALVQDSDGLVAAHIGTVNVGYDRFSSVSESMALVVADQSNVKSMGDFTKADGLTSDGNKMLNKFISESKKDLVKTSENGVSINEYAEGFSVKVEYDSDSIIYKQDQLINKQIENFDMNKKDEALKAKQEREARKKKESLNF